MMTKKDFEKYTDELEGDILFRLKENGGSMLSDTMDNVVEDIYKNMFKNRLDLNIDGCWLVYIAWVEDVYKEMIELGWIKRDGKTFRLLDKGYEAESRGAKKQKEYEKKQSKKAEDRADKAEYREAFKFWVKVAFWVALFLIGLLLILGYIQEDNPILRFLQYLK